MSPQSEAALALARQGLRIFPVIPNDKRPLIKGWNERATCDVHQVASWWAETPDANIGLPTERLLVVDIDPRNGGSISMTALRMTDDLPDTWAAVTAGGGAHLLFALPEHVSVKSGVHVLGPGIDVKSHGGYIVAAGSQIGDRKYSWVPQHSPAERPVTPAPQWLLDRCERPARKSDLAGKRVADETEETLARIEHYLARKAPDAIESERDTTAIKVANVFYDEGATLETATEYLLKWNEDKCQPPMDRDVIELKARSALKTRQNPVGCKSPDAPGLEPHEIDETKKPQSKPTITLPESGIDLIESPPPPRPTLYALSYSEAATKALTEVSEPLIEGLLDRQAMSVWYGESNSGKTFVMLDAAWHIAAGRPWAGKATKPGAVAYVAAEGGKGILKRVRALKDRYPDAGDVPLHIIPCPVDLLRRDADLKPLVALIRSLGGAELVVIDTLSRAIAGGNENDSTDMGVFVAHLDALRRAIGAHVAVVHHTGKDKAKGARGHSLLRAATDTEIEIDNRTVTATKQRDMDGRAKLFFTLRPTRVGISNQGTEITSCTVDMNATGPAEVVQQPLTPVHRRVADWLKERLKGDKPDNRTVFGWELLLENRSNKDLDPSTLRGYLLELLKKGWIVKLQDNQYVMPDVGVVGNPLDMLR